MQAHAMSHRAQCVILTVPRNSPHSTHALLFMLRTDLHTGIAHVLASMWS